MRMNIILLKIMLQILELENKNKIILNPVSVSGSFEEI